MFIFACSIAHTDHRHTAKGPFPRGSRLIFLGRQSIRPPGWAIVRWAHCSVSQSIGPLAVRPGSLFGRYVDFMFIKPFGKLVDMSVGQ